MKEILVCYGTAALGAAQRWSVFDDALVVNEDALDVSGFQSRGIGFRVFLEAFGSKAIVINLDKKCSFYLWRVAQSTIFLKYAMVKGKMVCYYASIFNSQSRSRSKFTTLSFYQYRSIHRICPLFLIGYVMQAI